MVQLYCRDISNGEDEVRSTLVCDSINFRSGEENFIIRGVDLGRYPDMVSTRSYTYRSLCNDPLHCVITRIVNLYLPSEICYELSEFLASTAAKNMAVLMHIFSYPNYIVTVLEGVRVTIPGLDQVSMFQPEVFDVTLEFNVMKWMLFDNSEDG